METAMTDAPRFVKLSLLEPLPTRESLANILKTIRRITWDRAEQFFCRMQGCANQRRGGAMILTEQEFRMILILPLCWRHTGVISEIINATATETPVPFRLFTSAQRAKEFLDEGPRVIKERGPQGRRPDDVKSNPAASPSGAPGGAYGSPKIVPVAARAPVRPEDTQSSRAREENARRAAEMRAKYADPAYLDKLAEAPRRPGHVKGLAEIEAANRLVDAAAAAKAKNKNNSKKGDDKKGDKKK